MEVYFLGFLTSSYGQNLISKKNFFKFVKQNNKINYLELNQALDVVLSKSRRKRMVSVNTLGGTKLSTKKILLMDDEKIILKVASAMLKTLKYEIEIANDGKEAIDLYKKSVEENSPFDLIIMDLLIPNGMGGKEAAKIFSEFENPPKIIASSGNITDPIMSNHLAYGFNGVIAKPYRLKQFKSIIESVLT